MRKAPCAITLDCGVFQDVATYRLRCWLRDRTGKLIARYDKSDDRTRERSGRIVGNGDQRLRKLGDR